MPDETTGAKVRVTLSTCKGQTCIDPSLELQSLFAGEIRYIAVLTGRNPTYLFEREFLARVGKMPGKAFSIRKLKTGDYIEVADTEKVKRYYEIENFEGRYVLSLLVRSRDAALAHAAALDAARFGDPEGEGKIDRWLGEPEPDPFDQRDYADDETEDETASAARPQPRSDFVSGSLDEVRQAFIKKEKG